MQRYEKYKDSGVDWIGQIPEHWEVRKIKYLFSEKSSLYIDGDWIESKDISSDEVYYFTTGNIQELKFKNTNYTHISESTFKKLNCTEIKEGDLLVSRLNLPLGRTCFAPAFDKKAIVAVDVVIFRCDSTYNRGYLLYLMNSSNYFLNNENEARGAIMKRISRSLLGHVKISIPSISEQQSISIFLDDKTAKIDQTTILKQKEIELLKERRQILIQKAVTKGLDNNVKVKDSGVDWIGKIPEHWNVVKNKTIFKESKRPGEENLPLLSVSIHSGVSDNELSDEENIRGKIKIEDKSNYKLVIKGDIVYNMMRAWQGAIGSVMVKGLVSPAYVVATPNSKVLSKFFEYQYRTSLLIEQMNQYSKGITDFRKRLYWEEFKQMFTILPPFEEQISIVNYIDKIEIKISKAISIKQQEIEKLKEYKTVLIDNVVTGKIKVT